VNSTVACALVAVKRGLPVAHVEAGLRSFDRAMPEESNRVVVDALSTWLFTPSADADENLLAEGVDPSRIIGSATSWSTVFSRASTRRCAARCATTSVSKGRSASSRCTGPPWSTTPPGCATC